jgi:hypothetical protein
MKKYKGVFKLFVGADKNKKLVYTAESDFFDTQEEAAEALDKLDIFYMGEPRQMREFTVLLNEGKKVETVENYYMWNYIDEEEGEKPIIAKSISEFKRLNWQRVK